MSSGPLLSWVQDSRTIRHQDLKPWSDVMPPPSTPPPTESNVSLVSLVRSKLSKPSKHGRWFCCDASSALVFPLATGESPPPCLWDRSHGDGLEPKTVIPPRRGRDLPRHVTGSGPAGSRRLFTDLRGSGRLLPPKVGQAPPQPQAPGS